MIVLHWQTPCRANSIDRVVLIFGVGLIGRSISAALINEFAPSCLYFPFSWKSDDLRDKQIDRILKHVVQLCSSAKLHRQFDIVWSAGKAGFASSAQDFESEQQPFESVLSLARRLDSLGISSGTRFHLFSSAGGLFEGQRNVDASSEAAPMRPYGIAKIRHERLLLDLPRAVITCTYRPSSVYGYVGPSGRIGLIVAALRAILQNTTARIFAQPDTLRDYVFAADIGRFLKLKIMAPPTTSQSYLLASGKPTSTLELMALIGRVMERRLSVRFELSADNTMSNTFRTSALPEDWVPTALQTGISLTAMQLRNTLLFR